MSQDEREKLIKLLDHWIEHNVEHADGYSKWAAKAKEFGKNKVHDEIIMAIQHIKNANVSLGNALDEMKK
ncbi:MAG: hypothetical protein SVR08_16835 [Spirochaetota bacterium]|nr:hypothetical protein [Spirochaetota bacterium]